MINLIKKMSCKTVCGDVKKLAREQLVDGVKTVAIMRVIGVAQGMVTGTGDNGDWVSFKGGFEGTNLIDGAVYKSGKLFLPEVAEDLVVAALNTEGNEAVNLAFDISILEDAASATGYVYTATPLMEVEENDPIEQLKKTMQLPPLPTTPKLAAPKEAVTTDTKTVVEKAKEKVADKKK